MLSMSGEIYFERPNDMHTTVGDYEDSRSIFKSRNKIRSDAISVIDAASSILSQGGGNAFSVRSDFFKQLSSVATPASQKSQTSKFRSNTIVRDDNQKFFSRYRARSKVPMNTDEIFEAKSHHSKELTRDALDHLNSDHVSQKLHDTISKGSKQSKSLFHLKNKRNTDH